MAQTVKRLPTMRETRVRSLGRENPLEKEMTTHSSTLAWKIPDGGAGQAAVHGITKCGHDCAPNFHFHVSPLTANLTQMILLLDSRNFVSS